MISVELVHARHDLLLGRPVGIWTVSLDALGTASGENSYVYYGGTHQQTENILAGLLELMMQLTFFPSWPY